VERIDVVLGSVLTGVIGLAIAVACAATLNRAGIHITMHATRRSRAAASGWLVCYGAVRAGLLGASLLAAAIVPSRLPTRLLGFWRASITRSRLSPLPSFLWGVRRLDCCRRQRGFSSGLPLIPFIYASQVVNAVLLPLHVVALQILASALW